jgi:hypothetical protein
MGNWWVLLISLYKISTILANYASYHSPTDVGTSGQGRQGSSVVRPIEFRGVYLRLCGGGLRCSGLGMGTGGYNEDTTASHLTLYKHPIALHSTTHL